MRAFPIVVGNVTPPRPPCLSSDCWYSGLTHSLSLLAGDSILDSSRRGILKKPREETSSSSYSRSTVVSQRQVVAPDGTVSLTRDVIRGE